MKAKWIKLNLALDGVTYSKEMVTAKILHTTLLPSPTATDISLLRIEPCEAFVINSAECEIEYGISNVSAVAAFISVAINLITE